MSEELNAIRRKSAALWDLFDRCANKEQFVTECVRTHKGFTREQIAIIWGALDLAWQDGNRVHSDDTPYGN